MQMMFAVLLLLPVVLSATQQKGMPFKTFAIHMPVSLLAGFGAAYPASLWLADMAIMVGYLAYYLAFYLFDQPFRNLLKRYFKRRKS
ncbi:hypothetical protein K0504_03005 [Neiella marina]|uniref:Uncharacterized protein n=1 Tax=Neiella holothuriorum TaxID=2870530 RepID=A0ABS7ECG8_9GAMM|nr:hypothetical protein [Neiella holothuriorum]MBW8189991.1 hypothetical protein [Neiella holothuriorum]